MTFDGYYDREMRRVFWGRTVKGLAVTVAWAALAVLAIWLISGGGSTSDHPAPHRNEESPVPTATKVIAREGGSAPFEPVSATHDVRAVVSTDEAAAPDSGPPPRTGDRDRDLREYARWAIRRTGYYNGTDPGYLGPRIDDVVADRTLNPDGKELDEVERELLRVVLKSEAQAINTLIAGRLELERDAMLRSVDSGAYSTFVGREEFVAHREKMQAYGERYVDWIESQMVFESDWGGETMVVFVTRANEPQFFAAQDRYAERKRVERDLIRGFFASLPR